MERRLFCYRRPLPLSLRSLSSNVVCGERRVLRAERSVAECVRYIAYRPIMLRKRVKFMAVQLQRGHGEREDACNYYCSIQFCRYRLWYQPCWLDKLGFPILAVRLFSSVFWVLFSVPETKLAFR